MKAIVFIIIGAVTVVFSKPFGPVSGGEPCEFNEDCNGGKGGTCTLGKCACYPGWTCPDCSTTAKNLNSTGGVCPPIHPHKNVSIGGGKCNDYIDCFGKGACTSKTLNFEPSFCSKKLKLLRPFKRREMCMLRRLGVRRLLPPKAEYFRRPSMPEYDKGWCKLPV
jgi:hypothetical protein